MRWLSRLKNLSVIILGVVFLLYALLALVHGIFGLKVGINEGRFGFNPLWNPKTQTYTIASVVKGMSAERAGLRAGDIVERLNDQPITSANVNSLFRDAVAGSEFIFSIHRGEQRLEIRIMRRLLPLYRRLVGILFLIVVPLFTMAYAGVGLWGVVKAPSAVTHLIALVCFSIGGLASSINISATTSPISSHLFFFQIQTGINTFSLLAPAFWLLLFLHFPQPDPAGRKSKILSLLLVFPLPISLILWAILAPLSFNRGNLGIILFAIYMGLYFVGGVMVFARRANRETDVLKKRQYQLMRFGIKYGAICILTGFSFLLLDNLILLQNGIDLDWIVFYVFLLTQLGGLIIPFTFLNSFFGNRILETESALKRRLRYIGASAALLFAYLILIFNLGRWFISRFQVRDPSLILLLILILSLTFTPLNRRILQWLEQKLYPEKNRYRESLHQLIRRMPGFMEIQDLFRQLTLWFENTMKIHPVHLLAMDSSGTTALPFKSSSPQSILKKINTDCCFFWDQLGEKERRDIDEEENRWASENGISITLPLIAKGELVGLLNLGQKKNREDFTGDDLEIFREAAEQTAIYLQNIRLQYEYLEKKRLDGELELARTIQNHLLPNAIPPVSGLEVTFHYQPCHEVGGDYFDIIPLDNQRTALTIADVSGKGAGAALLMANLQASLKMALHLPQSLEGMVERINRLVFQNSLPNQFITFFLAIWNPSSLKLEYINCGHNPPLLHRADGTLQRLKATGIGLGIRPDYLFCQEKLKLHPGDLLTIYTDGIEDFFNPDDQAFGSDRLAGLINRHRDLPPGKIIELLFAELEAFARGEPPTDDLTIIMARVKEK